MPTQPNPRTIGHGNGQFLADIAQGMNRDQLLQRHKAGAYPGLWAGSKQWLTFKGGSK